MLVIERGEDETFVVFLPDGREVHIGVVRIKGLKVRLSIKAPQDIIVLREELLGEHKQ